MIIPDFYPYTGGAERQCLKLSKKLVESGVDITVVTRSRDRKLLRRETIEGVPVRRLMMIRPFELAIFRWLFYLVINRNQYDILHVHMVYEHTLPALIVAKIFRKPAILKFASSGYHFDLLRVKNHIRWPANTLINKAIQYATRYICISRAVFADLERWNINPKKIVFIPNGVDTNTNLSTLTRTELRRKLDLRNDKYIVLRVGSYLKAKGFSLLMDAWEKVAHRNPDLYLVSVGGCEIPEYVWEFEKRFNTSVRIIENMPDGVDVYYMTADILVMPSLAEGLSNVLLESQAYGLPVVATAVGGNLDVVSHGVNGLLVDVNNPEKLAEAIEELACDKKQKRLMRQSALQMAHRFSMDSVAHQYIELYKDLNE